MTRLEVKISTGQENSILFPNSATKLNKRQICKKRSNFQLIFKVGLYFNIELMTSTSCDLREINLPTGF